MIIIFIINIIIIIILFCKAVCEYIINKVTSSYVDEYAVLYKYKQTINKEDCIPSVDSKYKETIKLLLDKYNLAEFWFYDKPIIDRLFVYYHQVMLQKVVIIVPNGLRKQNKFMTFLLIMFNLNMMLIKKLLQHLKVLKLDLMMLLCFGSFINKLLKVVM